MLDEVAGLLLRYLVDCRTQHPPPCLRKPTFSTPSPTPPSSSSRRPSASWTPTRTVFSHSAIQQFKEAFGIMDADKDGLLSSSDLVAAFGAYGKNIGGGEAQAMLDEVDGPMNFTQMVTLFASKMAGGSDDDDVILASFEAFEMDGKIDADAFRHSLMTFGNKFSASEVDDAFAEFKIDGGMIDAAHLKGLMVSK